MSKCSGEKVKKKLDLPSSVSDKLFQAWTRVLPEALCYQSSTSANRFQLELLKVENMCHYKATAH